MLETLITSKTRIKVMIKFFSDPKATGYLRGLEEEFGDSTNAIRQELNRFEAAGFLSTYTEGNRKYYKANTKHPGYPEIKSIVRKHLSFV